MTKGFIDPYYDNFKRFEKTHSILKKTFLRQKLSDQKITQDEYEKLMADPDLEIPDWFKSG